MSLIKEKNLVAIMFTDITGYTSISTKDEQFAFELIRIKKSILLKILKKHKGKFIKEIGDGTLSYFENPTKAIESAIELIAQSKINKNLNIRVGLHYGSVILAKDDIYGDAVNIASRVESMSTSNSILITKDLADNIKLNKEYSYKKLGLYAMKGVGKLIDIYNIIGPNLKKIKVTSSDNKGIKIHKSKKAPTIAIMPLKNKGDKKDDFYAYGISANLLNDVTSLGNIKVPNLRKVENLKGTSKRLCNKLSVQYLLNGTLWKLGNNFQISIDLYDNLSNSYIWQDFWQDNWDNLSAIQEKIFDGLVKTLNKSDLNIYGYSNSKSEAYEFYLKGSYYFKNRKKSRDIEIAQGYFINAVEKDNTLLIAKNYLGVTYIHLGKIEIAKNIYLDVLKQSKNNDDIKSQAMALSNIGEMYFRQGDYRKAKEYYDKSIKIRYEIKDVAGQATQIHNIAAIERIRGDFSKSLNSSKEVIKICKKIDNNELCVKSYLNIGDIYHFQSKYSNSLLFYKKAYDLSLEFKESELIADSLNALANVYTSKLENKKAINAYRKANTIYKKLDNMQGVANIFNNIGLIYLNDEKYQKSKINFEKSIKIKYKLNDKEGIANCLLNMGNVFLKEKNAIEAEKAFLKSLKIFQNIDDVVGVSFSFYSLGEVYRTMNKIKKSIENFNMAKKIDKKLNDLESVKQIEKIISNLNDKLNNK